MSDSASSVVQLQPRRNLTPAQELIWTSQRLEPDSPHQNMALLTRFAAPIDPARFLAAVDSVISDSDALRTTIREIDGIAHPSVAPEPPARCRLLRLAEYELESWAEARVRERFDLAVAAYDLVLIDLGNDEWAWWANLHHIVIDAGSSANLFNAVAARYHGSDVELPAYADVWAELAQAQKTPRFQRAVDQWAGQPDATPTDFYRPDAGPSTAAERVHVDMSAGRQGALDALLADEFRLLSPDISLFVALATALAGYTARLGNDELTIGVPIHHRSTKNAKAVIGPLVEFFALRVEVDPSDSFASLHKLVSRSFFELLSSAIPGSSARQQFDVVLNVHAATLGDFGPIAASTRWVHPGHVDPHHRLRVQALDYDGSGTLELALDINERIANSDHRQRAVGHFAAVLDAMLENPGQRIHDVSLVGDDEQTLLRSLSEPSAGTPLEDPAPVVLAQQLLTHANSTAVRHTYPEGGRVELSSREVDVQIDRVATLLRRAGFGPGDLIGIEMPIGIDAVLAIHGVQRAGAAFVPIDPSYPDARREHLRTDSGCGLVITDLRALDELPVVDPAPAPVQINPSDLAYVIYTSGSTGLPKGVPITHQGLSEYLGFALSFVDTSGRHRNSTDTSQQLVMPLFTSLSFDLTITTLFLPLLVGGTMTIHPEGGLTALREIVDQRDATMLKATPSHLELLARMIDPSHPLSTLIVGGEAFTVDLADRLRERLAPGARLFNEYGPTEAVVGCMEHLYDPSQDRGPEVPIGTGAPGVGLHILDPFGHTVPIGVAGELYVSRPGMTSGYLGRPDLNTDKFVPYEDAGTARRLYRTGDLVRLLDADAMVYLGRIDEQIKVGGIRLEPGEIEHVAQSLPGVRRAVARLWSPDSQGRIAHCVNCGLGSNVPDVTIDGDGVCSSCHHYHLVAPQAQAWFKTEADLAATLASARERSNGYYDVVHLISGGKDSTYALYKLVEMGARVYAITLDNGFLAEVAKANIRRATHALGVDHEFVTIDGMNEIFKDSLERFSNVCQGCYKAIYTIALAKAEELGIGAIVTGLSRGQFFETRLVPGMFESDRFDPDAIDEMVKEARHVYHSTPDAVSEQMEVGFLADETIFERIEFIDLYRYVDVELSEMYATLEGSGTWQRPPDSGRSTNCLINAAGIYVHTLEQGHHNYAEPYSWDVRLGHKTRAEVRHELDDPMNEAEMAAITSMLAQVGYEPRKPEVLTLWLEAEDDLDVDALKAELSTRLPSAVVPQAIEVIDRIPLTTNGKVDVEALPAPRARRRDDADHGRDPATSGESDIAAIWANVLGVSEVSATADFFALGGTSLHALEMIVRVSDHFGLVIPESMAFTRRTVEELARYVDEKANDAAQNGQTDSDANVASPFDIPALPADELLPLSSGEQSMLYEWRRDPTDLRYNVARLYTLPDDVDIERFNDAVRLVVAHQQTLHTSYGPRRQSLDVNAALWISSASSEVASIERLATHLNATQFDLVSGRLVSVYHLTSDHAEDRGRRAVLVRAHHIVSDAGSLDVFWNQIDLAYQGLDLPPIEATYAEHGAWQKGRALDPAEAWSPEGDVAAMTALGQRVEDDGYVHRLSPITMSQLRNASATTPFAGALTALGAALRPYHDGDLMEVSVTSSVRDHPAVAEVVGYFLNPLPLLLSVPETTSVGGLSVSVADTLAQGLAYRSVPFADIVRSARERGVVQPSGRVMLAVEDLAPAELDGALVEHKILSSGTAVNDLTFFVQIRGERVELGCEYRGQTIGRALATRLLDDFADALDALARTPHHTVDALAKRPNELVGPVLDDRGELAPTQIAAISSTVPSAPAVRCGHVQLTYGELDDAARKLAARLRGVGVGEGDRVAVVLPRSVDLVVAINAAWMIGASYVPIDISHPPARVTELISAAGVRAAVTIGGGHRGLSEVTTVYADRSDAAILPLARSVVPRESSEAYLIFTSGSEGRPKGVPISHGNLRASVTARLAYYREPVERYLVMSSAGFDSSVAGIFWALATGGELVFPTEEQVHDLDAIAELITSGEITHTLMVPLLYRALLTRSRPGALDGLCTVVVAGEACPPALVSKHFSGEHFGREHSTELVNEYGPTEATVWATAHRCSPEDATKPRVPIGSPIAAMSATVVDENGKAVPIDVVGELWLTGPSVASGYLGEIEDGQGDRFITPIDRDGTYRTGDLVVRRADGSLEFLGRIDSQLSVGGVRIEPTEVERALMSVGGVKASLVEQREGQLIGWVEAPSVTAGEVASALSALLPATHLPSRIVVIESLPRNHNGKLDRSQLSDIALESVASPTPAHVVEGSADPVLRIVTGAFETVFEDPSIDAGTDFFERGGDSLQAVALVSMLEAEFGRRVAIGELIAAPTPALLTERLAADLNPDRFETPEAPETESQGPLYNLSRHDDLVEVLRETGAQRPLIVLPPGGGNLLRYAPLVRSLDPDIPVVGVRLPGADARSEIVDTIASQAQVMLDAVDSAIRPGPYRLLGWSTGGLLAWEIARLLTARGDEVELVVLVDTVMAGLRVDDTGTITDKYRELLRSDGVGAAAREGASRLRERAEFAVARRRYRSARTAGEMPTMQDAERQLGPVIRRAALGYEPAPLDVPVLYVGASESDNAVTLDPWADLQRTAGLPFEEVGVDGVHFQPEDRCIIGTRQAPDFVEKLMPFLG